jgi:hypothetical protein
MTGTFDQDPERMHVLRHMKTVLERLARSRRAVSGVLALMTAMVVVLVAPAPAMADETFAVDCAYSYVSCQTGVEGGLVEGQCMTSGVSWGHNTSVCVKYDGDYVYVRDGQADGHAAIGKIVAMEGSVSTRYCRNPYGYGTWARCNFDWSESGVKVVYGGYFENPRTFSGDELWRFSSN